MTLTIERKVMTDDRSFTAMTANQYRLKRRGLRMIGVDGDEETNTVTYYYERDEEDGNA